MPHSPASAGNRASVRSLMLCTQKLVNAPVTILALMMLLPGIATAQPQTWTQVGPSIGAGSSDSSPPVLAMTSDGSTVAVGLEFTEKVRVFSREGDQWLQVGADINGQSPTRDANGFPFTSFGHSVAISDDGYTIAVGAPEGETGSYDGLVRVFDFNGASWIQRGPDFLAEGMGDQFGEVVALSADGSIIAIGAPLNDSVNDNPDDGNAFDEGQVRVYGFDSNTARWLQLGNEIVSAGSDGELRGDNAGWEVALSDDGLTIAIGSPGYGPSYNPVTGQVRIFTFDGSSWNQIGNGIEGDSAIDRFGESLAISSDGRIVAIGSVNANSGGRSHGHLRVYRFEGSRWAQLGGTLFGEGVTDPQIGSAFGLSVAMSSDGYSVVVGSALGARVFDLDGNRWSQRGSLFEEGSRSVAMSSDGRTVAISGGSGLGRVYTFGAAGSQCNGLVATISGSGTVRGTTGNDVIVGSPDDDLIIGLGGDDVICGMGGNDRIFASAGRDTVFGGDGDDFLAGDADDDLLIGGAGDDTFIGGSGRDIVTYRFADGGVTVTFNGAADDGQANEADNIHWTVEGVIGSEFDDNITGSNRNNLLRGRGGNDVLRGLKGRDEIYGGNGNDVIEAGAGNDIIGGGQGADMIDGGINADRCIGGAGVDVFSRCESVSR